MPKQSQEQPDMAVAGTGIGELLRAHRAISDAWYSNWRLEQRERLNRILQSRSSSDEEVRPE
jgi:hypothetical protein